LIRAHVNYKPNRKFIFVGTSSQLEQTTKDLKRFTELEVISSSAKRVEMERIFNLKESSKHSILFITHDTLNQEEMVKYIYSRINSYYGIIVDEAHLVSNFTSSNSAFNLRALLRHFPLAIGLTATPVTTDSSQLGDLLHMYFPRDFDNLRELRRDMQEGENPLERVKNNVFVRSRRDVGVVSNYRTHYDIVEPHEWQIGADGLDRLELTRGEGALNQRNYLIDVVKGYKGFRGLIFIERTASREWVEKGFREAGIKFKSIHGQDNKKERTSILDKLNKRELDVVITSVPEALNMSADYVYFYEYTADVKQMLGRAERGLNPKTLDIHFMFTRDTGDADFFVRRIYRIALWIQMVVGQDYREILKIGIMASKFRKGK
jgi:superfamily II DNA or RNA helicase